MPPNITVLNVAEKPSVARALASIFSNSQGSRDRPPIRNASAQIFITDNVSFPLISTQGSGTNNSNNNTNNLHPHTMITTSVRGHLAEIEFTPNHGWNQVPPISLFNAPIETRYSPNNQPLVTMLQQQSKSVQAIILWLDCDREGEAICDEVRTVCLDANPRLSNTQVYRAKFSTLLAPEIHRALFSLGRVNECFVQAVQARSEHDLRVGAAFTRFQTLRLQKKFEEFANGSNGVVSYGPCQFPTLGFVVERWARIETFIPDDFWYLEMMIQVDTNNGSTITPHNQNTNTELINNPNPTTTTTASTNTKKIYFKWKRDRLYDRLVTLILYQNCLDSLVQTNDAATVIALTGQPKNKWRPVPLATVELQKRASKYLRIGSERLMSAAEELYQMGYISYPRTETEKFRPEFDHRSLIQQFGNLEGIYGEYSRKLLYENGFQNPRAGQHDDNAHPPITPCKAVDPQTIPDATQRDVYILVVKHYLACCSRDAIGKETSLTVKIATEEFKATGLMIVERNWLEIYSPFERWSTGQGELPRLEVGSRIRPSSFVMKDGRTTAPLPISEVELISLMDRNGIGTDATIAQHIANIQERDYVIKDNQQRFLPTKLGIALVEGYNSMGYQLNKPDLRREMEAECNAVATGRKRKADVLQQALTKMRQCYETADREATKLDNAMARHFTKIGSVNNTTNTNVVRRNFSKCGTCNGFLDLREIRQYNNNQGQWIRRGASNNDDNSTSQNNVNNRNRAKVLQCQTCSVGFVLPKGIPNAVSISSNGNDTAHLCPICNFQVLKITEGDGYTGNGYHLCPKCFTDSPTDYGGSSIEFRCYNCIHPTCSLASGVIGSDLEVFPCPFCSMNGTSGKVSLKKNTRGYILSCSNYSRAPTNGGQRRSNSNGCEYTIWLPREARSISILENNDVNPQSNTCMICNSCSNENRLVRKVKFIWKPGSVPPDRGREYVGCVLCDAFLKSEFHISIPQVNQVRPRNVARRGGGGEGRTQNPSSSWLQSRSNNTVARRGRGGGRGSTNTSSNWIHPRGNNNNNSSSVDTNQGGIVCFRCGEGGHYATSCPQRQR